MRFEASAQDLTATADCPVPGCAREWPCRDHPDAHVPPVELRPVPAVVVCRRCSLRPAERPVVQRGPYARLCVVCKPEMQAEMSDKQLARRQGITFEEFRARRAASVPDVPDRPGSDPDAPLTHPDQFGTSGFAPSDEATPTCEHECEACRLERLVGGILERVIADVLERHGRRAA